MQCYKFLIGFLVPVASCFLYLNRTVVDFNPAFSSFSVNFGHDTTGQCVVNVTFISFVTITSLRVYFKINLAEDQFDKEFKKVFVSSVFELDKVFKGKQSNVFINVFFSAVKKAADFEFRIPLPPVIADNHL